MAENYIIGRISQFMSNSATIILANFKCDLRILVTTSRVRKNLVFVMYGQACHLGAKIEPGHSARISFSSWSGSPSKFGHGPLFVGSKSSFTKQPG